MPSSVVGNGVEGGYEGQTGYSLSAKRPFIVTMEICDTVSNPVEREGTNVDEFCENNGGLQVYSKAEDDKDTEAVQKPEDLEDPEHPYTKPPSAGSAPATRFRRSTSTCATIRPMPKTC